MSLRKLAGLMDMSHSQLSLTFSSLRRMQLDEAVRLARIFNVPLTEIAHQAGIAGADTAGRRVNVEGAMDGAGQVVKTEQGSVERVVAPGNLPEQVVAVQARTAGTNLAWMDGWVMFRSTETSAPAAMGQLCVAQVSDGPVVVATVTRGYREGAYNLSGPYTAESAPLDWVSRILAIRP